MTEDELARLERIEKKLDQMLEFRDMVLAFVTAGAAKKATMLAKSKIMSRQP